MLTESKKRENHVSYLALEYAKYKVCFRKLDLKTKKVTFKVAIVNHKSEEVASLDTV